MALQLAAGRPPALSPADLREIRTELDSLGAGFESSLLDYPDLVGSDGRQDFLHFFLYSLIVAPAVPVVSAVGLHPNWAFTLVNALLLTTAVYVVARKVPLIAAVAGFVSPIIWWVDKAHTEAFLFATVSVAAVSVRSQPALALVAFAFAGAQNAALGATYPVFAAIVWFLKRSTLSLRDVIAGSLGAVIVAAPFVYSFVRLGRWSPMAEYAQRVVPSLGGLAAFLVEPNIGIAPHAPAYAVAVAAGLFLLAGVATGRVVMPSTWWWPAGIQLLLMLAWSQNPNANHGGTPGVNRWVLSLLALSIPWIALARGVVPSGGRIVLNIAVGVSAVLSAAAHMPSRSENYRAPTALAEAMWRRGLVHVTPAEVFAERLQGREPAAAPAHDGTCGVLLIADQHSPMQCRPPVEPLPRSCRLPGAMCYAVVDARGSQYVSAPTNGFFYQVNQASWPAGGPFAAAMDRMMRDADPTARVWRVENSRRWQERLPDTEVGAVIVTSAARLMHIVRTSESTRRALEAEGLHVVTLVGESRVENLAVVVPR